jgi:Ca-activated chloride channel family protein
VRARWRWLGLAAAVLLALALAGCGKRDGATPGAASAASAASSAADDGSFTVLAGSEVRDLAPALMDAASEAGVKLKLSYAGTLDIIDRVNAGEHFDAILPANGAYPAVALSTKPVARDKLFYSRVALGIKVAKLKALGWDIKAPTWADIARAAGKGQLRYAMTNPTSSNTGMSALFAVASAAAGKTEDLKAEEIDSKLITAFLAGQKLTAGSSGWLAEAFAKAPAELDAMVNYEAVIMRTNDKLGEADKLQLLYPQDGVISADYPLMLLNAQRQADYTKLIGVLKAASFQRKAAAELYLRPAITDVPLAAGIPSASVAELSFPNRLDVFDAVLSAYQGEWKRPSTSIFVLDTSGSMYGERITAMRNALKVLAGANANSASARYMRFQNREKVLLITFSDTVSTPTTVSFDAQSLDASRAKINQMAEGLSANGGTAIYAALLTAQALAAKEHEANADRFVSIVLLTDGANTAGPNFANYKTLMAPPIAARQATRVFPILFGESDTDEMNALATFTGGRVFDGRKASLVQVFKEIRGYQ